MPGPGCRLSPLRLFVAQAFLPVLPQAITQQGRKLAICKMIPWNPHCWVLSAKNQNRTGRNACATFAGMLSTAGHCDQSSAAMERFSFCSFYTLSRVSRCGQDQTQVR